MRLRSQTKALADDVAARLRARRFPVAVLYGPEALEREGYQGPTIVIARDDTGGDTFRAPAGAQRNARNVWERGLALIVGVFAASTLPGARREDHEALADILTDASLVALYEACKASRLAAPELGGGRFLRAEERAGVQTWPGVVYEYRAVVSRGVYAFTWDGAAEPEATIHAVASRTESVVTGSAPAVGCGA